MTCAKGANGGTAKQVSHFRPVERVSRRRFSGVGVAPLLLAL